MKMAWVLAVAGCIGGLVFWLAATGTGDPGVTQPPPKPEPRLPLSKDLDQPYHGLAWQIHQSEGCVELARQMLGEIADLGADSVLISNAGYQKNAASESFKIDPRVTPSPEQWEQILQIAHDNGLRVILMPIILLSDPLGTEWRGVISPPSWDDWFEQYRNFLTHFARIAAKGRVEVLSVGSELVSTERYTDRWRRLIREIREIYPARDALGRPGPGRLTYSANWDHYKVIEFWDDLDLVGMTSYYKLASEPNPSLESLIEAWKPIRKGLLKWQAQIGKPLLFTEVGWCSQEGAAVEPWNYYYKQEATAGGLEEQRRCYRAFMETWRNTPEVGGVIWWEWNNTEGGRKDFNYIPKGKPAELELREWFRGIRLQRATARKGDAEG